MGTDSWRKRRLGWGIRANLLFIPQCCSSTRAGQRFYTPSNLQARIHLSASEALFFIFLKTLKNSASSSKYGLFLRYFHFNSGYDPLTYIFMQQEGTFFYVFFSFSKIWIISPILLFWFIVQMCRSDTLYSVH